MLREAKAAQAIMLAAIKFMIMYQLLLSVMYSMTYYLDGSQASLRQVSQHLLEPTVRIMHVELCFQHNTC